MHALPCLIEALALDLPQRGEIRVRRAVGRAQRSVQIHISKRLLNVESGESSYWSQ